MARQNTIRTKGLDMMQIELPENQIAEPIALVDLKGMNTVLPLSKVGGGLARLVRDLTAREGAYQTRDGTSILGNIATANLVGLMDLMGADNNLTLARVRINGVDTYGIGAWVPAVGDTFTSYENANLARTAWGETLVFSTGTNGIYQLTPGNPANIQLIPNTPTDVHHLTAFNKRVIASLRGTRIQWSANADSLDWTGLGSGFEDLISSPGGQLDTQTAVVPVTDELALVIRSNSVWQMTPTGNFDAPFRFGLLFAKVGSHHPGTVVQIPRGAMFLGKQAVWRVGLDGFEDVGKPIRNKLAQIQSGGATVQAAFDDKWQEYRLSYENSVLRYNLESGLWTEDIYPFPVRALVYTVLALGVTVDELEGLVNDLPGRADDLGMGSGIGSFVYAMGSSSRYVARDDPSRNNEALRDVNEGGVAVEAGFRIETGNIAPGGPLRRAGMAELQVEYEAESSTEVNIEYSTDGGVVWNLYSVQTLHVTTKPEIISFRRWIERDSFQWAISSTASGTLKIINFVGFPVTGARIADAR